MQDTQILKELDRYKKSSFFLPDEEDIFNQFVDFITTNPQCFQRNNTGHITSSVWIVDSTQTNVLLTHHKKFNLWLQLGGHNDGETHCAAVALKEAQEESGITSFTFLAPTIFDIDVHPIPGPCAYHYDIRYLLKAENDSYIVSDESHDLAWVPFKKIVQYNSSSSVVRMHEKAKQFLRL